MATDSASSSSQVPSDETNAGISFLPMVKLPSTGVHVPGSPSMVDEGDEPNPMPKQMVSQSLYRPINLKAQEHPIDPFDYNPDDALENDARSAMAHLRGEQVEGITSAGLQGTAAPPPPTPHSVSLMSAHQPTMNGPPPPTPHSTSLLPAHQPSTNAFHQLTERGDEEDPTGILQEVRKYSVVDCRRNIDFAEFCKATGVDPMKVPKWVMEDKYHKTFMASATASSLLLMCYVPSVVMRQKNKRRRKECEQVMDRIASLLQRQSLDWVRHWCSSDIEELVVTTPGGMYGVRATYCRWFPSTITPFHFDTGYLPSQRD